MEASQASRRTARSEDALRTDQNTYNLVSRGEASVDITMQYKYDPASSLNYAPFTSTSTSTPLYCLYKKFKKK